MNARQFAYVASRIFAVYVGFQFISAFAFMAGMVVDSGGNFVAALSSVFAMAVTSAIALFFWFKADLISRHLAPNEPSETADNVQRDYWEILGLAIVGAFALKNALAGLVTIIIQASKNRDLSYSVTPDVPIEPIVFMVFSFAFAFLFLLSPHQVLRMLKALRGLREPKAQD